MYEVLKRLFDFTFSLISILILLPLLIPVVILLKFTSEGEIFYLQERIGLKNNKFYIYKFATMLKNSAEMKGGYITVKNDPRLTFLGGFLRKSKINELPQLFNILFGHMSIVGPRPVMQISFESYPIEIRNKIYNVKPGLTGIGSIIFRDEEDLITEVRDKGGDIESFYKNSIYPYKGELEIWYQENRTFYLDLRLIFITAWVIIFPKSKLYEKWFKSLPTRNF